jgi:hypothetical protein
MSVKGDHIVPLKNLETNFINVASNVSYLNKLTDFNILSNRATRSTLCWSASTAWHILGLQMEKKTLDVEGSYKYNE